MNSLDDKNRNDQEQKTSSTGEPELLSPWAKNFFSNVSETAAGKNEAAQESAAGDVSGKLYGGDYDEYGTRKQEPAAAEAVSESAAGTELPAQTGTETETETEDGIGSKPEEDHETGAEEAGEKKAKSGRGQIQVNVLTLFLAFAAVIILTVFVTFWAADRFYFGNGSVAKGSAVSFEEDGLDSLKVAKFQDIIEFIRQNYYKDYDINKLVEGAIGGLVDALEDPYGGYYPPGNMSSYTDFIEGSYTGIGFRSAACDEGMEVTEVFADSPAEKAGILVGDKVTHINGKAVKDLSSEELSSMLGVVGTEIRLSVLHTDGKTEQVTLKVEKIITPTVTYKELENNIKYIYISQFIDGTAEEFRNALLQAASGCSGLIIDLRNNPGGYEREASAVADMILPEGTIATSRDRHGNLLKTVTSDKNEITVPVVLLVNQNSASASELVAGAFRDFKKGELVGVHTYGKALAQINKTYEADGSGIVLTTSRYYTPSGECIDGVGIEPTVKVELSEEYRNANPLNIPAEQDTQLAKAIEIIKGSVNG